MEIGFPQREIYIEPLRLPVPERTEPEREPAPRPIEVPEPEKVPA